MTKAASAEELQRLPGIMLETISELAKAGGGCFAAQYAAESTVAKMREVAPTMAHDLKAAALVYLNTLLRSGFLAFGQTGTGNWSTESLFLTEAGNAALKQFGRDPINKPGYMDYIKNRLPNLDKDVEVYVVEALDAYAAGCHRAVAVLVGAALEMMILRVRDRLVDKMVEKINKTPGSGPVPPDLNDWKISPVHRAIRDAMKTRYKDMEKDSTVPQLGQRFASYWDSIWANVKMARDDNAHPVSVAPQDQVTAHANLLNLPNFAKLAYDLGQWIETSF